MRDIEAEDNKNRIKELEEKLHQQDLDRLELLHKLELEKTKVSGKKFLKDRSKTECH